MSDLEEPTAQGLSQQIEALCTELAPLTEEYETAESVLNQDPLIRNMRQARSALSLSFAIPSSPHIAAAKEAYIAAIPTLEELVPRVEANHERFSELEDECLELANEHLEGFVELKSEIFAHEQQDLFLALFGLMGLTSSLAHESETTKEYYGRCLEQAKSDIVGTTEWADEISPFRAYRTSTRHHGRNGDL
ncbi:uncharacterized protein RCC_00721 [Ramularia collo-cygni]|uniref:Uncharacterized protein n=1 Tax=Ramularia collo-cygni TaxID=112498 RepID=A0A2D3UXC4_9PEZI|nr:uncharacterized protein RCC_00721 [Ramularia collo-cygni]CZT14764.1 uncharacterized protein RCC_00721 [Ramularia collo-cygni]